RPVGLVCAGVPSLGGQQKGAPPPPKKSPLLKLVEPWPEDDVLLARRTEAEKRTLFGDLAPLPFTLTADFQLVNKDRNPDSTKRYAATMSAGNADAAALPVRLGTR